MNISFVEIADHLSLLHLVIISGTRQVSTMSVMQHAHTTPKLKKLQFLRAALSVRKSTLKQAAILTQLSVHIHVSHDHRVLHTDVANISDWLNWKHPLISNSSLLCPSENTSSALKLSRDPREHLAEFLFRISFVLLFHTYLLSLNRLKRLKGSRSTVSKYTTDR